MGKSTRKKPAVLSDELRSEMMTVREVASYLHCRHYFNVYWLVHQAPSPAFVWAVIGGFVAPTWTSGLQHGKSNRLQEAAKKPDGKQRRKRRA